MERATIQATKRGELGSRPSQRLRRESLLPAVLYGHQRDPVHLALPLQDVERLLHEGGRVVDIEIGGTVEPALLKDIQYDAFGDQVLHIDLARIDADERVTVAIAVELHGLAKGAASGGILDHVVQDLEVECLAMAIPEKIRVEIASLDIGDVVHVRDLVVPEGVRVLHDPDAPVVTIHPPVTAVAVAAEEEVEAEGAEPEVVGGHREKEDETTATDKQR